MAKRRAVESFAERRMMAEHSDGQSSRADRRRTELNERNREAALGFVARHIKLTNASPTHCGHQEAPGRSFELDVSCNKTERCVVTFFTVECTRVHSVQCNTQVQFDGLLQQINFLVKQTPLYPSFGCAQVPVWA